MAAEARDGRNARHIASKQGAQGIVMRSDNQQRDDIIVTRQGNSSE